MPEDEAKGLLRAEDGWHKPAANLWVAVMECVVGNRTLLCYPPEAGDFSPTLIVNGRKGVLWEISEPEEREMALAFCERLKQACDWHKAQRKEKGDGAD